MVRSSWSRIEKRGLFFWLAGMVIYLAVRFIFRPSGVEWIDSYLSDILSVPVIAGMTTSIMQVWKGREFRINFGQIIFIALYISVVFEFILPKTNVRYTQDFSDVICYFSGGIIWICLTKTIIKANNHA